MLVYPIINEEVFLLNPFLKIRGSPFTLQAHSMKVAFVEFLETKWYQD
jgi:hypothetical protein